MRLPLLRGAFRGIRLHAVVPMSDPRPPSLSPTMHSRDRIFRLFEKATEYTFKQLVALLGIADKACCPDSFQPQSEAYASLLAWWTDAPAHAETRGWAADMCPCGLAAQDSQVLRKVLRQICDTSNEVPARRTRKSLRRGKLTWHAACFPRFVLPCDLSLLPGGSRRVLSEARVGSLRQLQRRSLVHQETSSEVHEPRTASGLVGATAHTAPTQPGLCKKGQISGLLKASAPRPRERPCPMAYGL